ncbi:MAG: monovalent cation/H(+) antiporter subunit G [Burkholderiaceae bacterium]|nr:monovalent cation/H(+) antiporter subunit G [Burkholderiaceae bacterium]
MNAAPLPLWLEAVVALLVLAGALTALLSSIGLLRLPTFFERVHAPALTATLGCWCIVLATLLYFSASEWSLALHTVLIALFLAITTPITSIFLIRAALFRARQSGQAGVPPSLSAPGAEPPARADTEA